MGQDQAGSRGSHNYLEDECGGVSIEGREEIIDSINTYYKKLQSSSTGLMAELERYFLGTLDAKNLSSAPSNL